MKIRKFPNMLATQVAPPASYGVNFSAGIVDIGGKFIAGVNDTGGHIFPERYTDHGDTGGKFATVVNDSSGQQ
jgi:hypothetical protein